jgi:hypothetical protein
VNLTDHELTAASSVVAALAIIGGYLGVRSANRNAVKIAREERSSRRKDELDALKRTTYAKCLAALMALATANAEQSALLADPNTSAAFKLAATRKRIDAMQTAHDCNAELTLISPDNPLPDLATEALIGAACFTTKDGSAFIRGAAKLRGAMVAGLRGGKMPSPHLLNRIADTTLSKPPSKSDG